MKNLFPSIIAFYWVLTSGLTAQIPNSNFENWTGNNPDPAGWYTWHNPTSPYVFITRSSLPCWGNYSLKSTVIPSQQPNVYISSPVHTGTSTNPYIPISVKPHELHGCFIFDRPANASVTFNATVNLKSNGVVIGSGTFSNALNVSSFQNFVVNISYTMPGIPDSVSIRFDFGLANPLTISENGAYYILDSLSFQNIDGIMEGHILTGFKSLPNPFSGITQLEFDEYLTGGTLRMFDARGMLVRELNNLYGRTLSIERGDLSPGVYFVIISGENQIPAGGKLLVQD
jgi:hypothetical protein